ncbi:hypothetical protein K435DRAFT_807895 [Dendrothele bispora CBS 962.96]|uniref:Uncharacterized protein n=1 Tax=Dendrothele bispora (strain CBS 962.96) TaxID=1314807 RepID=A0A4S8L378_DENBC|nr:hypothetical protein K435DRAFT_807895 [Dendrothele bispora CBS 962.96]
MDIPERQDGLGFSAILASIRTLPRFLVPCFFAQVDVEAGSGNTNTLYWDTNGWFNGHYASLIFVGHSAAGQLVHRHSVMCKVTLHDDKIGWIVGYRFSRFLERYVHYALGTTQGSSHFERGQNYIAMLKVMQDGGMPTTQTLDSVIEGISHNAIGIFNSTQLRQRMFKLNANDTSSLDNVLS